MATVEKPSLLDEALALVLKLPIKQRLQLIERAVSSVERDIETPPASDEHWGQSLNRLLDTLDVSEWQSPEFEDPVAWLKQQREQEYRHRVGDWGIEE